jgi:hypothetical protein
VTSGDAMLAEVGRDDGVSDICGVLLGDGCLAVR